MKTEEETKQKSDAVQLEIPWKKVKNKKTQEHWKNGRESQNTKVSK